MNVSAPRFARISTGLVVLVTLAWVLTGQAAKPARRGVSLPTDWSHRRLIFSQPGTAAQMARVGQDPRYVQQLHRRSDQLMLKGHSAAQLAPNSYAVPAAKSPHVNPRKIIGPAIHRDWSQSLGAGASVGAGNYPAKFSFDSTTADCAADYVAYSTGLLGSSTQATIVGYNNLYSGCATGTVPTVLWAYNTSISAGSMEQILTSPVPSLDGTQLAFVETTGSPAGQAELVLLKWAASGGTVGFPVTPTRVLPAAYRLCTAPCLTEIFLIDAGLAANDSSSSVFYDYTSDIAWVGTDGGYLHKFTGVFTGTPAESAGAFPVQVSMGGSLSSPVLDHASQQVYVQDGLGSLDRVDATTGAVVTSAQLQFGAVNNEGPVVDSTNGLVYVFSSADNSTACGTLQPCSAVYQLPATFAALATGTETQVGIGTVFPATTPMYIGSFDSAYYNSTDATGNLYVCGDTGAAPTVYQIPVLAGALPISGSGTVLTRLTLAADTPACSPITDIANPNTAGGPSERLFVSVQNNGISTGCGNTGCILSFVDTQWLPSTVYALGQQILVRNISDVLDIQTVIAGGTSGTATPTWPATGGVITTTDGTNGLQWINQGALRATTPSAWLPTHAYGIGARVLDTGGDIEVVTTAGTSDTTVPVWPTTAGATIVDGGAGGVTWTNAGPIATFSLQAAGGTSGIIIDNVVPASTLAGTSQVYFSTLSNQACTDGTGGCAVQASQPDFQ